MFKNSSPLHFKRRYDFSLLACRRSEFNHILSDAGLVCIVIMLGRHCRCFDTNLLEVPVEIESPDHHYYHV